MAANKEFRNSLDGLFSFYKLIFVTISLVLLIEIFQLLMGVNYYPEHSKAVEVLKTGAFFYVLVSIISFFFAASFALLSKISKIKRQLIWLCNTLCLIIIGLVYIPAFIVTFTTKYPRTMEFFWGWGYSIIPILIALIAILMSLRYSAAVSGFLKKIVAILWLPMALAAAASFICLIIFIGINSTTGPGIDPAPLSNGEVAAKPGGKRPNIILITFDGLSARDMSLYGYKRKTTPYWEHLAKESFVFDRAHSQYNQTVPSIISLLTSKYPLSHGVAEWPLTLKKNNDENIATVLAGEYHTAAIVASMYQYPHFLGLKGAFDYEEWVTFNMPRSAKDTSETINNIFDNNSIAYGIPIYRHLLFYLNAYTQSSYRRTFVSAFSFLLSNAGREEPLFLWTHLWPPHPPFVPKRPFKGTFLDADIEVEDFVGTYTEENRELMEQARARYDEYILYSDSILSDFIGQLKSSGLWDSSIVIITSDHGMIFDKGWLLKPSPYLYEPFFHVPLLIHLPGQRKGARIDALAEHIDILPTVMELIDMPTPEWSQGESLVKYLKGMPQDPDKIKYSMVMSTDNNKICTVAAYRGDYKAVYNSKDGKTRLNNLRIDYNEDKDLSTLKPALLSEMTTEIKNLIETLTSKEKE